MLPHAALNEPERGFLLAVYELGDKKARAAVQLSDIQDHLSLEEHETNGCCDFWVRQGALECPALGHVALTHMGHAYALHLQSGIIAADPHVEAERPIIAEPRVSPGSPVPAEQCVTVVIPTLN
jgi:hypothetical protein